MKLIRMISVLLLLTLCLSGCGNIHQKVISRSPIAHTVSKADMPRSVTDEDYAALNSGIYADELPTPLHLIPRELFQTVTGKWIEYIPTIGGGVCYLYSYDAGEEIITYIVMLDIISSTYIGSHAGTVKANGKDVSVYGTRQDLQIGIASNCAIKWNKDTNSLTVWANPPFRPEVKATIQMEKEEYEGDNVGTVLTEWSFSGRVTDPKKTTDTPVFFTNVIAEMTKLVFEKKQIEAIEELSYGIIKDAEHRGEISYWSDYRKQDHTADKLVLTAARDSFQNNYLYQSYNYGGTALGGVSITHNGKLKNEGDRVLLSGRFNGITPEIAEQIKWTAFITLSFDK